MKTWVWGRIMTFDKDPLGHVPRAIVALTCHYSYSSLMIIWRSLGSAKWVNRKTSEIGMEGKDGALYSRILSVPSRLNEQALVGGGWNTRLRTLLLLYLLLVAKDGAEGCKMAPGVRISKWN